MEAPLGDASNASSSKGAIGDWQLPRVLVDTFTSNHHGHKQQRHGGTGRWDSSENNNIVVVENTSSAKIVQRYALKPN